MSQTDRIKQAFERKARLLAARDSLGRGTAKTIARVTDGLTCEVEEGPWKLTCDVGEESGGNNRGPNPGLYARAALGSCLAMSYATWAAKRDVPVNGVEVEIQADYDARGHYGIGDVTPGYLEVRYIVRVESDAPASDVLAMMDEADKNTAILDVFGTAQPMRREVEIIATENG
jgi:uncharacterized OsmC-like protein